MTPENLDLIAGWTSLVLTLMVFSYLLSDNVLYRLAIHVLVGVAAGYIAVVAIESVIIPWINDTVLVEQGGRDDVTWRALRAVGVLPLFVGVPLLFKFSPRYARIGDMGLAFVIGIGTAVAITGAVAGTIVPLVQEAGESIGDDALEGLVVLVGVICTLIYFQYLAVQHEGESKRPRLLRIPSMIGQFFVTITLGALYAGAILTSLAIFSDVIRQQLEFILDQIGG